MQSRAQLAASVRGGQVKATDLVEEALRRIDEASDLNAVVAVRADDAIEEAAGLDGDRLAGPLAGLPLLVKDMARCKGMVTTMGSPLYRDAPPDEVDDVVVARLKAAGAIVVGRTNSPAFGHTAFTTNLVYGPTRNPWNAERSPGGSSGGSAAALAAGLAPLATTSDGGGSVRIPACYCGLVGYKPTMGAIGRNVLPRWIGYSTLGCTGSTVDDVVLEASVVLGGAIGDFLSVPRGTVDPAPVRPSRVLACRTFRSGVDPVIEAAFDDAVGTLSRAGLSVETVESPSYPDVIFTWFLTAAAELAQSLEGQRDHWSEFEPSLRAMVEVGAGVSASDYIAGQRRRHEVTARFDDALGDDAVLVVPTMNVTSYGPEGPLPTSIPGVVDDDPSIATNTADLNFTGHPAVNVPLGRDDAGVPFGLQVVAPRFRDGLALGVAQVLERERPWPLTAPGYTPFAATVV